MNIGIDARTLMEAKYSGIPEYTFQLTREILRLDQKNKYVLFYNSARDIGHLVPDFGKADIVYTRYPNKIFNYLMQKGLRRPKIDELMGVDLFFMPHMNFAACSEKGRKIMTIHDLSFIHYPEFFSWRKNVWHRMIKIKKFAQNFDVLVAVSENTKQDAIELLGIKAEKIKVIYSGLDKSFGVIDRNDLESARVKAKYQLPEKFILFLGTIEPRKNVASLIGAFDLLIKEAPELSDYSLVIAGEPGWGWKNVHQMTQASESHSKIKFLGYVENQDRVYLYNLAAVFAYPSYYEGFGFPILEAMACGLPVIVGNNSSLTEVGSGAVVIINPDNINELKTALKEVLNNNDLRQDLKMRSLWQARKFNWEKSAREYIDLFEEVGGKPKKNP